MSPLARKIVIGAIAVTLIASVALAVLAFSPTKAYASCTPYYWCVIGCRPGCASYTKDCYTRNWDCSISWVSSQLIFGCHPQCCQC